MPTPFAHTQQANLKAFVRNGTNHSIVTDWAEEALKYYMVCTFPCLII